jgi:hypothetical protein
MPYFPWLERSKNKTLRGRKVFDYLRPYLQPHDHFLDVACGYAPMAKVVLGKGYTYAGFDPHKPAIEWLEKMYPNGDWICCDFDQFLSLHEGVVDVLLLFGMDLNFEVEHLRQLLAMYQPRIVCLEGPLTKFNVPIDKTCEFITDAYQPYQMVFNRDVHSLRNHGYMNVWHEEFMSDLDTLPRRHYAVFCKKCDS